MEWVMDRFISTHVRALTITINHNVYRGPGFLAMEAAGLRRDRILSGSGKACGHGRVDLLLRSSAAALHRIMFCLHV